MASAAADQMSEAVAVVVVTYQSRDVLPSLAESVLPQLREDDTLVVVDNCSPDGTATLAKAIGERVIVIANESNAGFAAACRQGVEATSASLILLLNPDARLEPGALDRLRETASERPDWAVWQAAVMLPDGRINTSGGVVHYLGIGWAGRCGRSASELPAEPYETAFASGAAMMVRRSAWDELDGFDDSYFLYCEDLDLGLRAWLAGRRVGVEPRARVVHRYDFDKGARKWYLLERNRWRTVLADYPTPLLILVLPALLASELALLAVAARGGWLRAKLRAQAATLTAMPAVLRRRARVQRSRAVSAREFSAALTASLESATVDLPVVFARIQQGYWYLVSKLLR